MSFFRLFFFLIIGSLLFIATLSASKPGESVFPPNKSQVSEAEILFIFQTNNPLKPGSLELVLNNEKLSRDVSYLENLAYVPISLQNGENQLVVYQNGQESRQLNYLYVTEEEPTVAGYTSFHFHDGFTNSNCGDCHDLQAKPLDFKALVVSDEALTVCLECHDDRLAAKYIHGPVGMGACSPCHEHHGSSRAALLRVIGNDLCHTCHEKDRTRAHLDKLLKAKADSPTKCLICHDSHGTEKKFQLK